MAFADHRCLQDYISRGVLPNLFANGQFIHVVATALAQSRGAVAQERRIRGREVHQGVVLRKQKDERYAAVAAPASDVLSGAQQTGVHFGGSFGGALEEIRSATAFVIAAPS